MQPARQGSEVKALIEFIARSLVADPTEVRVVEHGRQGEVRLELHVAEEDMGRVIGRAGRVANAMRTLLRVAAARRGVRANLDIL
ncbi:MAG TPA: KH domain-containing protein [Anaerolineales bacterium]|nr:KH domain-containing protein [Anaerolineales bacterium]